MKKNTVIFAAALFSLAIILGAFGAHGLKQLVDKNSVESFEVGIRYQFYISIAILILGLNADKFTFSIQRICVLMALGLALFSGSIYLLAIKELLPFSIRFLGPVTPIGGLIMIIGFVILIYKLARSPK